MQEVHCKQTNKTCNHNKSGITAKRTDELFFLILTISNIWKIFYDSKSHENQHKVLNLVLFESVWMMAIAKRNHAHKNAPFLQQFLTQIPWTYLSATRIEIRIFVYLFFGWKSSRLSVEILRSQKPISWWPRLGCTWERIKHTQKHFHGLINTRKKRQLNWQPNRLNGSTFKLNNFGFY